MEEDLETRIDALERAITDGDGDFAEIRVAAETGAQLDRLETDLGELQDRVCELEAATQALRGYVGNVRAVNEDVESRASAALAKAETIEAALSAPADDDSGTGSPDDSAPLDRRHTRTSETGGADATDSAQTDGGDSGREETGHWSSTTAGDCARRSAGSTAAAGRPTETSVGDGGGRSRHSTNPRCESCGRPHPGEHERGRGEGSSPDVDLSGTRSPADAPNDDGTLGGADGGEPDLAGLSENRQARARSTTTTDEPGTLERIRQLL
ncbi:MAG: ABC transporter C-terminal domain-containing protein [Halovenus sp.]